MRSCSNVLEDSICKLRLVSNRCTPWSDSMVLCALTCGACVTPPSPPASPPSPSLPPFIFKESPPCEDLLSKTECHLLYFKNACVPWGSAYLTQCRFTCGACSSSKIEAVGRSPLAIRTSPPDCPSPSEGIRTSAGPYEGAYEVFDFQNGAFVITTTQGHVALRGARPDGDMYACTGMLTGAWGAPPLPPLTPTLLRFPLQRR